MNLTSDTLLPGLNKYAVKLEIENILQEGTNESKQLAIKKSVENQVLCQYTGFICMIK